jgi:hypothetical protein
MRDEPINVSTFMVRRSKGNEIRKRVALSSCHVRESPEFEERALFWVIGVSARCRHGDCFKRRSKRWDGYSSRTFNAPS